MAEESRRVDPALLRLASYPHWRRDIIRFADLDTLGHVNNVSYVTFFETGRVGFFTDLGRPVDAATIGWMAVHLEIDYRRQLGLPGAVDIGTAVLRVGRSSVTVAQAVFADEDCAAQGLCVMVLVDRATNRPEPIPAALREKLSGLGLGGRDPRQEA